MLRYVIQCRDVVSGKMGNFVTDDEKAPFRAISPVFSNLVEFFGWLKNSEFEHATAVFSGGTELRRKHGTH